MYESYDTEGTKRVLYPVVKKTIDYNNRKRLDVIFYVLGLSKDDNKPRNVNFANKLFIKNLVLEFWQSPEFIDDENLISAGYRFKDVYSIDLETSKGMTQTLKKLYKKDCNSNKELLENFINEFKIKSVYISLNEHGDYSKNNYDVIDIDDFVSNFEKWEKEQLNYFNQ